MAKKPVMLMILDGFGIAPEGDGNAVAAANKPNFDKLVANYPHSELQASGMFVGLPDGQMGNSEVGHLNIGAGRIIYQELTRITKEINEGGFFKNEALLKAMENAKKDNTSLHLMGLLSNGGVHSHIDHLKGLLKLAKEQEVKNVYVHCFMDGRDVAPGSGKDFVVELENYMAEIGVGKIASISGRYYAMDRDNRWERVQLAYDAMVLGKGETATSAVECMEKSYADNKSDEFVLACVIEENGAPTGTIKNGDSVVFFNFRPDRAREITRAINDKEFAGFERETLDLVFVTMTQYDKTLEGVEVAYRPEAITNTLGEYVASKGLNQLRIAETDKYAHVTFFFDGGVDKEIEGATRVLVNSPKVATYDLQPEMSAYEVKDKLIEELDKEKIDGILEIPPKDDMGDFAFPCFQLAKVFRKAPNMIATEIAEKIPASEDVSKVEAMGPYVNFFLNKENYVKEVLAKVNGTYGAQEIGKGKTVCIDYSSPNIAKNFHVGHLRTTIIGNSLYHIFDKLGYKVERINHLGDWGTQFGKLIVAYKKWGSKEAVEEKGIPELLRIYVKFHEEAEKDDTLNDQAREWFV